MNEQNTELDREALEEASDWLRALLIDHAGEDVSFDALLGRSVGNHPRHAQNIFEKDRLDLFRGIVESLVEARGSEDAAAEWLFHDPVFKQTVGSVPFDYLEDGEFWALALLHDVLKVSATARQSHNEDTGREPGVVAV